MFAFIRQYFPKPKCVAVDSAAYGESWVNQLVRGHLDAHPSRQTPVHHLLSIIKWYAYQSMAFASFFVIDFPLSSHIYIYIYHTDFEHMAP